MMLSYEVKKFLPSYFSSIHIQNFFVTSSFFFKCDSKTISYTISFLLENSSLATRYVTGTEKSNVIEVVILLEFHVIILQ